MFSLAAYPPYPAPTLLSLSALSAFLQMNHILHLFLWKGKKTKQNKWALWNVKEAVRQQSWKRCLNCITNGNFYLIEKQRSRSFFVVVSIKHCLRSGEMKRNHKTNLYKGWVHLIFRERDVCPWRPGCPSHFCRLMKPTKPSGRFKQPWRGGGGQSLGVHQSHLPTGWSNTHSGIGNCKSQTSVACRACFHLDFITWHHLPVSNWCGQLQYKLYFFISFVKTLHCRLKHTKKVLCTYDTNRL